MGSVHCRTAPFTPRRECSCSNFNFLREAMLFLKSSFNVQKSVIRYQHTSFYLAPGGLARNQLSASWFMPVLFILLSCCPVLWRPPSQGLLISATLFTSSCSSCFGVSTHFLHPSHCRQPCIGLFMYVLRFTKARLCYLCAEWSVRSVVSFRAARDISFCRESVLPLALLRSNNLR